MYTGDKKYNLRTTMRGDLKMLDHTNLLDTQYYVDRMPADVCIHLKTKHSECDDDTSLN